MRTFRTLALGATLLALIVGACSSGGGSPSPSAPSAPPETSAPSEPAAESPSAPAGPALSTTLKLGGLEFAEFVPLDAGGPLTVQALTGGQIDVGLLFTSDPAIATNGFVLLEDDKQLQLADNIVPVVRQEVLDANPAVTNLLNTIMERLTQEELTNLNKAVTVDARPAADVASEWITSLNLDASSAGLEGDIIVGSTNFYEQEILGEIFAQILESNGATVERKFQLGNREIVFPALEAGEIDILAEYAATALEFVNEGAGQATTDPAATTDALRAALEPKGLAALDYAEATDQNGFVVTQAKADEFGLAKISDLAKPAAP
jgi:glycine betaine/choline ABC-type transport system substrate-binding protein